MRALLAVVRASGYMLIEEDRGRVLRVVDPATLESQMVTKVIYFQHIRPGEYDYPWQPGYRIGGPPAGDVPRRLTLLGVFKNLLTRSPNQPRDASVGSLKYDATANAVLVTDFQPVIDSIREIAAKYDALQTK